MAFAFVAPEPPPERPKFVTIVGGTFLVLASLRFLMDLVGWVVWKLGNPEPVVAFFLPRGEHGFVGADGFLFRHFPTIVAVQGTVAAGVAFISFNFLRLRPWARPALELVGWAAVSATTALAGAFTFAWTRLATGPNASGLAVTVAALLGLDLLLGAAIWAMRRPDVRSAFRGGRRVEP